MPGSPFSARGCESGFPGRTLLAGDLDGAAVWRRTAKTAEELLSKERPQDQSLQRTMDPDLENVIRQALTDAKNAGKDYLSQTEEAVRAVLQARPDMTPASRLGADLERVRRRWSGLGILSIIDQHPARTQAQMIGLMKTKQFTEVDH